MMRSMPVAKPTPGGLERAPLDEDRVRVLHDDPVLLRHVVPREAHRLPLLVADEVALLENRASVLRERRGTGSRLGGKGHVSYSWRS